MSETVTTYLPEQQTSMSSGVFCDNLRFSFYLIAGIMCVLGLTGNIVSIFVLRKDSTHPIPALLLQSLAMADNLGLIIFLVLLVIWYGVIPVFWPNSTFYVSMHIEYNGK